MEGRQEGRREKGERERQRETGKEVREKGREGGEKGREGWIFVKRADKTSKSWDDKTLEGNGERGSLRSCTVCWEK